MLISNSPHQISQDDFRDVVFKLRQALFETRDRIVVEFRCANPEHQTGARACGGTHTMTMPFPSFLQVLERSLQDAGWVVGPVESDISFDSARVYPPRHVPDIVPSSMVDADPTPAPKITYHAPVYTEENSRMAVEDSRRFGETNNLGEDGDGEDSSLPDIEDPDESPFDEDADYDNDGNEDPFGEG